jgi:hypothetical protein
MANCASPEPRGGEPINAQASSVTSNIVNEAGPLHKTIVDSNSGQYAIVDSNKVAVVLKDTAGKPVWSINIAESLETNSNPRLRGRKISGLQMYKGDLWVDLGRGYAIIDVKTGRLKGTASN